MKKFPILFCIVLLFTISAKNTYAQETIMSDISYPYLEKLIATAKLNYPQVKIRQEQALIAQNTYKQAKKSWFDLLTFSYVYSPQTTVNLSSTNIYNSLFQGYQIAINLNIGNIFEKPYTIKNTRESYNVAMLEQQDYNLTLELDVKTRYFTYLKQQASVRLRTKSSVDAESIMSQTKHQFENGSTTVENYTRAAVAYAENTQAKIDAEASALIAKAALEEILGKKLEEIQ